MPDVLVTGATDGIGRATALALAARGIGVVVHGRDPAKVATTVRMVGTAAPLAPVTGLVADFADLSAVRDAALELADRPLAGVVNNAAVFSDVRRLTADGFELTWQVDHLAPALLTDLLLDCVAAAGGRVVMVSAGAYRRTGIDLVDPQFEHRPYAGRQAYLQAKAANVAYMCAVIARLGSPAPLTLTSLHPGVIATKLQRSAFGHPAPNSLDEAAAAVLSALLDLPAEAVHGRFLQGGQPRSPTGPAGDPAVYQPLYELTCQQLRVPGLPAR